MTQSATMADIALSKDPQSRADLLFHRRHCGAGVHKAWRIRMPMLRSDANYTALGRAHVAHEVTAAKADVLSSIT